MCRWQMCGGWHVRPEGVEKIGARPKNRRAAAYHHQRGSEHMERTIALALLEAEPADDGDLTMLGAG